MRSIWATVVVALFTGTVSATDVETLRSVDDGANGASAARQAHAALVEGGAENLLPVLQAFEGSSLLATNWLTSAFEAIADRETKEGRSLPKKELLAFIRDTSGSTAARRLAYEWLLKEDATLKESLIPSMLLDPAAEFRRDAVAMLLEEAEAADGSEATGLYEKALGGAVHKDQVSVIARKLRDAGLEVDLLSHFGFLPDWKLVGPFDNRDMKGFPVVYPPEKSLDLSAEYDGQLGPVKWQALSTEDDYGIVDIGEEIENYKGSVMYATTTYNSDQEKTVEFRLGTPNAFKLWLNGDLVFAHEEYHRSTRMDQFKLPVTFKRGVNTILLKVCQNEQTEDWAQDYHFQLRVCDASGSAVLPASSPNDVSVSQP